MTFEKSQLKFKILCIEHKTKNKKIKGEIKMNKTTTEKLTLKAVKKERKEFNKDVKREIKNLKNEIKQAAKIGEREYILEKHILENRDRDIDSLCKILYYFGKKGFETIELETSTPNLRTYKITW